MKARYLWWLVLLGLGLAAAGVALRPGHRGQADWETVKVQPGRVVKTLFLRGRSQPVVSASVAAQLEGRVEAVKVKLDQRVEAEQVLAEIELAPGFLLKVQEAVAEYERALAGREQQASAVVDSPARGRILKIMVRPGQTVTEGQPLAAIALDAEYLERLENLDLDTARLKEEISLKEREVAGRRDLVSKGLAAAQALASEEAELERLRQALALKLSQRQRLGRGLSRRGAAGGNEALLLAPESGRVLRLVKESGQYVAPGEDGALLYLARGGAGQSLNKREEPGRLDLSLRRLRQAESRVEALSAMTGRSYLAGREDLSRGYVLSPVAGSVTYINLHLVKGYAFAAEESLFEIDDLTRLLVVCRVHEIDFPKIKPGQKVEVAFDAFPAEPLTAALAGQPKAARTTFDHPFTEYEVVFSLDNAGGRLVGGLSAEVRVEVADKEAALSLPTSCLVERDGGWFVFRLEQGQPKARPVKIGLTGDQRAEILEGLAPGDEVVRFPERYGLG